MKLLVISSAPFIRKSKNLFAYSPYINEMEIWRKNVDSIMFCCPFWEKENDLLVKKIPFDIDQIFELKDFNFTSISNAIQSFPILFYNVFLLFYAIFKADVIHLRCPGNIGLLGCFVQIFFPFKTKTAKYAGNWDPMSKQPFSYKLQKWILNNTFLTKNMKVLVYGEWKNQSKNIKPFYTATYSEKDKTSIKIRNFRGKIIFLFVGTLSQGKRPLYAVKLIEKINKLNERCVLHIYGDGILNNEIRDYIKNNQLETCVFLFGNKDKETIKIAYQKSHFLVLPSKSEGWPKVIAEAMFWGCLPIATPVSCVNNMLDFGNRGIILSIDLEKDYNSIFEILNNDEVYIRRVQEALNWSRKFTLDFFESEIEKLIKKTE